VGGSAGLTTDAPQVTIILPTLVAVGPDAKARGTLELSAAAPNPFHSRTQISYTLSLPTRVTLTVYDAQGRQVARLVDGAQQAGRHTAEWTGKSQNGRPAGAGVYLVRLAGAGPSGNESRERKVVLLQ
jgi:flagellar hook assembly protein FlgD